MDFDGSNKIEDRIIMGLLITLMIILLPIFLVAAPIIGIFYLFGWIYDKIMDN